MGGATFVRTAVPSRVGRVKQEWTDVDAYFDATVIQADAALNRALETAQDAGLPAINVTPHQGKFLQLLARIQGARTILEIGTLAGYSTIWLARALPPGGRVVTLEAAPAHAEVARGNIAAAGLSDVVEVRVGPALQTLPELAAEGHGPFDFVFIDADKRSNPDYFGWAMRLSRPGSIILIDNVVRGGRILDAESEDADLQGIRRLHEVLADEPTVSATTLQTVGRKGWDGFTLVLRNGD